MRYVGIAALAATFWLLVATVRLTLHQGCQCPREALTMGTPANGQLSAGGLGPLTHAEVIARLDALQPQIEACEIYGSGRVTVDLVIAADGTVQSTVDMGEIAGTAAAICVTDVVRSATFRPSTGLATAHTFLLR